MSQSYSHPRWRISRDESARFRRHWRYRSTARLPSAAAGLSRHCLSPRPAKLTSSSDRLRVLAGNLTSGDPALAAAVRGQDAVISALGVGKSFKSCALIEESMSHLVRAMEGEGVRRLIFTSAFGVGDTYRDVPLVPRIFIRSPMPFRTPSPYERTISMLL